MLNKQAKTLTPKQTQRLLDHVGHTRYPDRNRVIVLLSFKAGLRAVEIAGLRWSVVTDASGELGDHIALPSSHSGRRTFITAAAKHRRWLVGLCGDQSSSRNFFKSPPFKVDFRIPCQTSFTSAWESVLPLGRSLKTRS